MPCSKQRNLSGDSKRIVKCGVCGQESRRDNLKTKHFPQKHPGIKYSEEGEQSFSSFFSVKNSIVPSDDDPMGDSEEHNTSEEGQEVEQTEVGEEEFEADKGEVGETEHQQCEVLQNLEVTEHVKIIMPTELKIEIMNMFEPLLKNNLEEIVKKLNEIQIQHAPKDMKNNTESEGCRKSAEDVNIVLLQIKSCRSISDLCTTAGLLMFRSEKQLVCDLCDDASENLVRKAGVFHYDFDIE